MLPMNSLYNIIALENCIGKRIRARQAVSHPASKLRKKWTKKRKHFFFLLFFVFVDFCCKAWVLECKFIVILLKWKYKQQIDFFPTPDNVNRLRWKFWCKTIHLIINQKTFFLNLNLKHFNVSLTENKTKTKPIKKHIERRWLRFQIKNFALQFNRHWRTFIYSGITSARNI